MVSTINYRESLELTLNNRATDHAPFFLPVPSLIISSYTHTHTHYTTTTCRETCLRACSVWDSALLARDSWLKKNLSDRYIGAETRHPAEENNRHALRKTCITLTGQLPTAVDPPGTTSQPQAIGHEKAALLPLALCGVSDAPAPAHHRQGTEAEHSAHQLRWRFAAR